MIEVRKDKSSKTTEIYTIHGGNRDLVGVIETWVK